MNNQNFTLQGNIFYFFDALIYTLLSIDLKYVMPAVHIVTI